MPALWTCPRCGRVFRQKNQAHSCGIGSRDQLLTGKPEPLVKLYRELESFVSGLAGVEIVFKQRYALFRTTRIFADLVFMRDALRLAIVLDRELSHPLFFKVARMSPRRVGHVAKLRTSSELRAIKPFLRQAYRLAAAEHPDQGD